MCLRNIAPKLAVSSVFESIIRDTDKFIFLVSNRFCNGGRYAASQPYIGVNRALILSEAQKIFELMERDLTITIVGDAASIIAL
ncbi:MAG: hypothetical protein WA461_08135 [Nitrososphaeraceae archaeon]